MYNRKNSRGASMVEMGVILALVALVSMIGVREFGRNTTLGMCKVNESMENVGAPDYISKVSADLSQFRLCCERINGRWTKTCHYNGDINTACRDDWEIMCRQGSGSGGGG